MENLRETNPEGDTNKAEPVPLPMSQEFSLQDVDLDPSADLPFIRSNPIWAWTPKPEQGRETRSTKSDLTETDGA
jgi:hypothetical protein